MREILLVPLGPQCSRCGGLGFLFARLRDERLCLGCWRALPPEKRWPPPCTMHEAHDAEVKAREQMTARGGTDRHLVRVGRS